ncbi:MAG: hypothetical protein KIH63_000530 [Candidatus Saccharibacteria bacterium]|nr:hypothetical protein [Candidatus Saccharibacteria bacterium]
MNLLTLIAILLFVFAGSVLAMRFVFKRRVNKPKYKARWQELQKFLASRETWPLAVITADKLLDEALKKRRFKGRSMGERLVSAQRTFSDNDGVWFAHNLSKKLADESAVRLRQVDVKKSLVGVRQALRDLGVLE